MGENGGATPLKVLLVASEVAPFAKVGGMADVAAALPVALRELGHEVRVAMPCYGTIDTAKHNLSPRIELLPVPMGGRRNNASILEARMGSRQDVPIYFVRNDYYFDRPALYGHEDDGERFILFSRAVLEMLPQLDWFPDVIHCNNWQTGIIPNWLGTIYRDDERYAQIASVFTIHSLSPQGVFPPSILREAQIADRGLLYPQISTYKNDVNLLGRGVLFADVANTVSEQYAREILTPEYGEDLDPLLNEKRDHLFGILDGVDVSLYNPSSDELLASRFDADRLDGRKPNKAALQREAGLPEREDVPLFGAVSRLVEQKGFDIMFPAVEQLLERYDAQFVLLGTGEERYERQARELERRFPDKMKAFILFSPELARRIYGGIDIFVMPSRFEPSGLSQMVAMLYGAVPVVRHTGGLVDTVDDYKPAQNSGTGFVFGPYTSYAFSRALVRALEAYGNNADWQALQRRGMSHDFSWNQSAARYVDLYRTAIEVHGQ